MIARREKNEEDHCSLLSFFLLLFFYLFGGVCSMYLYSTLAGVMYIPYPLLNESSNHDATTQEECLI